MRNKVQVESTAILFSQSKFDETGWCFQSRVELAPALLPGPAKPRREDAAVSEVHVRGRVSGGDVLVLSSDKGDAGERHTTTHPGVK